MKKDIHIPVSKNLVLGIVPDEDNMWDMYLYNLNVDNLKNVLIVTTGYNDDKVTSTLRYFLEALNGNSCIKFETIMEDVMNLKNTIMISYSIGLDLYEIEFSFSKDMLDSMEMEELPLNSLQGYVIV